jgi:hypothetical protein
MRAINWLPVPLALVAGVVMATSELLGFSVYLLAIGIHLCCQARFL